MHTNNTASPDQISDELLITKVAQGDAAALEALYDRHAALVLGMCLMITGDHTTAERVLQETFWRVWQSAASYQNQRGHFPGWLFRMARQLAIDARQSSANH